MLKFLYIYFYMQYSLLYSFSIVQHFFFLQNEIISTRKKVYLTKTRSLFQGHQGRTYQTYF